MPRARKYKKTAVHIRRSGFVYKLYLQNLIHLWIVAAIMTAILLFMLLHNSGVNYLMNYLAYRGSPNETELAAFCSRDMLDLDYVMEDIEANGGEQALYRQRTSMFYKANVYQEGKRYRFGIEIDPAALVDTGIYYDDNYIAYTGITDRSQLSDVIPRENYCTEHLFFYDYAGMTFLLAMDYDIEQDLLEAKTMRVTFAPIGVYSLYMAYDLYNAGYTDELCNYLIDVRETPVDFEDEVFKDLVMYAPFALAVLIVTILLTIFPTWHPTYHQLAKYGRTVPKAVEKVEEDYEAYGIQSVDGKITYLNEWLVKKSFFKNGIERNFKKQPN